MGAMVDEALKKLESIAKGFRVHESSGPFTQKFHMIKELPQFKLLRTFNVKNDDLTFSILLVSYTVEYYQQRAFPVIPQSQESVYCFILLKCNKHYGIIRLRPRTFVDKVTSLFFRSSVGFKAENGLTNSFVVESENSDKARTFFTKEVVQFFKDNKDVKMELMGRELLIRKGLKPVSESELGVFLNLGFRLASLIHTNTK